MHPLYFNQSACGFDCDKTGGRVTASDPYLHRRNLNNPACFNSTCIK